jgi:hypothetical protein
VAKEKQKVVRQRNRYFIFRYLNLYGECVDCGIDDWEVLEFDHIDPSTKIKQVSYLYSNHYSLKKIKTEIKKCELRCANCHRKKTRKQLGWLDASKMHL